MLFDTKREVVDLDDKTVIDEGKPLTFRKVATNSLLAVEADGNGRPIQLSGEEKVKRYDLAMRIHKAMRFAEIKAEEASLLKMTIAKFYGAITVGQMWDALDNPPTMQEATTGEVVNFTPDKAEAAS